MNVEYKKFIAAVSKGTGLAPNDVAMQCIAATMNLPSMGQYLDGAAPPACQFDVSTPAPALTANPVDPVDTSALEAEIASLKAEIESLRNTTPAPVKAAKPAKAPKAPKAAKTPAQNSQDGLTFTLNGSEVKVRSWRGGAIHMFNLLIENGKKADVPSAWFRDTAEQMTTTLPSGDHVFSTLSQKDCIRRMSKIAEVLNMTIGFPTN